MNETYIRFIGLLMLILIGVFLGVVAPQFLKLTRKAGSNDGLPPMMSLEFFSDETAENVGKIVINDEVRQDLRKAVAVDTWRIAPLYTFLNLLLCLVLSFRVESSFGRYAAYFAVGAALLALVGVFFDVTENYKTDTLLRILDCGDKGCAFPPTADPTEFKIIPVYSMLKFAAIFLCSVILSFIFLQHPLTETGLKTTFFPVFSSAVFVVLILSSIAGLVGLRLHNLIPPAMGILYFAALFGAVCLIAAPQLYAK